MTNLESGIGLRFGYGLPDNHAIPSAFMGEQAIGQRRGATTNDTGYSGYAFAHVDAVAIGYAVFWDGTPVPRQSVRPP